MRDDTIVMTQRQFRVILATVAGFLAFFLLLVVFVAIPNNRGAEEDRRQRQANCLVWTRAGLLDTTDEARCYDKDWPHIIGAPEPD